MITGTMAGVLKVLKELGEDNINALSKKMGRPYPLIYNAVKKLWDAELVTVEKRGRSKIVRITPKGVRVLHAYMRLLKELGEGL